MERLSDLFGQLIAALAWLGCLLLFCMMFVIVRECHAARFGHCRLTPGFIVEQ
jgi:hypothetical protein